MSDVTTNWICPNCGQVASNGHVCVSATSYPRDTPVPEPPAECQHDEWVTTPSGTVCESCRQPMPAPTPQSTKPPADDYRERELSMLCAALLGDDWCGEDITRLLNRIHESGEENWLDAAMAQLLPHHQTPQSTDVREALERIEDEITYAERQDAERGGTLRESSARAALATITAHIDALEREPRNRMEELRLTIENDALRTRLAEAEAVVEAAIDFIDNPHNKADVWCVICGSGTNMRRRLVEAITQYRQAARTAYEGSEK